MWLALSVVRSLNLNSMLTLKAVNRAIAHLQLELVRGGGYFYFLDTTTGDQVGNSVMVYTLNQITLAAWVAEATNARS